MAAPGISIEKMPSGFDRWQELLGLILRSFDYMHGVINPPSSALRLTVEGLRAKAQAETCFLAMRGPDMAGCVFVSELERHLYVGKLAVEPQMQGMGIGRALLAATETLARELGKPALELQTRVELVANQAAFRKLGFREAARNAHEGYARPTSVTLRKELS